MARRRGDDGGPRADLEASDRSRGLIKPGARARAWRSLAATAALGGLLLVAYAQLTRPAKLEAAGAASDVVLAQLSSDARVAQSFKGQLDAPVLHHSSYAARNNPHSATKTRVKLSGERLTNPGGCDGRGPRPLDPRRPAPDEAAKLAPLGSIGDEVKAHLRDMKGDAEVLSPDHETLCSWDPQPFLPSMPRFSDIHGPRDRYGLPISSRREDDMVSAFSFHDVCVSFNMNSNKQAQRGLVFVDPLNEHPERCVACSNPQTSFDWISNPCGIMWMHQVNIKSLSDYQPCYDANLRLLKKNGQEQAPGSREDPRAGDFRAAIYYKRPVLILNYVVRNPGHQLWDTLFSLIPILMSQEAHGVRYFDFILSHETPECEEGIWICEILRRLGAIRQLDEDPTRNSLLPTFKHVMPCFSHVIVPVTGWNRENKHSTKTMLSWIQKRMRAAFQLDLPARDDVGTSRMLQSVLDALPPRSSGSAVLGRYTLAVYSHHTIGESGQRRAWLNIDDFGASISESLPFIDVHDVRDFAQLSIAGQARTFHEADIILMPHGGQFGNSIFIRPGTVVIEVTCGSYSNMASHNTYAPSAGFYHVVQAPCHCTSRSDRGNFDYSLMHDFAPVLEMVLTEMLPKGPSVERFRADAHCRHV